MRDIAENCVYSFLKVASASVSALPDVWRNRLADLIGYAGFLIAKSSRRVAFRNLNVIFGKKDIAQFSGILKRMFLNYGRNVVDFLCLHTYSEKWVRKNVLFAKEDKMYLESVIASNSKGTLLITAHFGNWEILGLLYGRLYGMHSFYLRPKLRRLGEFIVNQRENTGSRMVEREDLKKVLRILSKNGVIGGLADHDGGPTGVIMNFFGKRVSVPSGMASLAYKTGTPIIPTFVYHEPEGKYRVKVMQAIYPDTSAERKDEIIRICGEIIRIYEDVIRKNPEEWLLVYDRWKKRRHTHGN